MTTYNTQNPLGSTDPRDLYDNAENLDNLVNGDQAAYNDRLGKSRKSWQGIEDEFSAFIAASGYEFVGDYAAGIELTGYQQVVRDINGEFWRLSGSVTLPYTTTGAGLPEGGNFVAVGDAVLRQELAGSLASGQGANLVNGATIYAGSVAELEALSLEEGTCVYLTQEGRAGNFVVKSGTPPSDPQKGIYIVLANGNYAQRIGFQFVTPEMYGAKGDGVSDDTAAIQAAVDSGMRVLFSAGDYKITSQINVMTRGQILSGSGWATASGGAASRIFSSNDIVFFRVSGNYCQFENLFLESTAASHNKPHIHFAGDAFPSVRYCRLSSVENVNATGGGILLDDGAGGLGGSAGLISNCNISHGFIDVRRSDVHIKNSFCWANSRPYAIKAVGSVGNLSIEGCDILPPQTTVPGLKAGIYLSGSLSIPKIINVNFDGNNSLSTGPGLLAENGVINLLVNGGNAFGHDQDCIILDSIIAPVVSNVAFTNNNRSGNGSVDILLRESFAQLLEKPLIQGNSFTQTAAKTGIAGAAIKLAAGTFRRGVQIINNTIHQPGSGGGYSDVEINLEDGEFANALNGSLSGNIGTRTHYSCSGMISISADESFKTIPYGVKMAYAPRPDQIKLSFASVYNGINEYRFNAAALPGTTTMGLGFPSSHPAFDLYWSVDLS